MQKQTKWLSSTTVRLCSVHIKRIGKINTSWTLWRNCFRRSCWCFSAFWYYGWFSRKANFKRKRISNLKMHWNETTLIYLYISHIQLFIQNNLVSMLRKLITSHMRPHGPDPPPLVDVHTRSTWNTHALLKWQVQWPTGTNADIRLYDSNLFKLYY